MKILFGWTTIFRWNPVTRIKRSTKVIDAIYEVLVIDVLLGAITGLARAFRWLFWVMWTILGVDWKKVYYNIKEKLEAVFT